QRRDLGRLDLASPAPEDVGVPHGNPCLFQMLIDGRLVGEHESLLGTVAPRHDVHIAELGAALTPVRMGEDVVPADLLPGLDLPARGNLPVEEGIVAGDPLPFGRGLVVLQEGGEPAYDPPLLERTSD